MISSFLCPFTVTNISERTFDLWGKVKQFLQDLNLFPSIPPSTDEYELRTQRISTRVFIILFILSMTILLFYTSLVRVTKTIDVPTPTLEKYSELYSTYSERLTCACSKISINYDKLLRVQYTLHQVCRSVFVSEKWINQLSLFVGPISSFDFRVTGKSAFRALNTFCDLISDTISDSLTRFYSSQYVSAFVTPPELFQTKTESLVDQFRSSLTNSFLLSLSAIRSTTQGNALFSAEGTNFKIVVPIDTNTLYTVSHSYGNCSCSSSGTCIFQSSIYHLPNTPSLYTVPYFYIGCYVIEALLRSRLWCFYNQDCVNELHIHLSSSLLMDVNALDSSAPSEYSENSTIQELIDNLMIEEWTLITMYDRYYNECQPTHCTYALETRNDIIYIFTTLFGIAGGLITVLKFVVPRSIKLIRKKQGPSRPIAGKRN